MAINADDRRRALSHLNSLSEARLRQDVLIPLYRALGFRDVVEAHGQDEYGKDLLFKDGTRFGDSLYLASLVKKGKIHGSSAKSGNVAEVLNQAREAFEYPFKDQFDNFVEKHISMLFVVASGEITAKAKDYVSNALAAGGVNGSLRFHDGEFILSLLEHHIPSILQTWLRPGQNACFGGTATPLDYYPTLDVLIRHPSLATAIRVTADFDTGASQSLISGEFLESQGVKMDRLLETPQSMTHLGRYFVYARHECEMSLDGSRFVSLPIAVVRDWGASTLTLIRPGRVMLLGRDVPLALGARVSLDFSEALGS